MSRLLCRDRRTAVQIVCVALFAWGAGVCLAQAKPQPPRAAEAVSYDAEAVVVEKYDTVFRYNADGTGDKSVYERIKIQNEAGARQLSVLSLAFAAASEDPKVTLLLVHHPDGTSTETPGADAIAMPSPVSQQAPLYSDLKVLQIPVRNVRAGDTLEYRVAVARKNAESPSQFWENTTFLKGVVVLSETVTLDVPADKYVQVWSRGAKPVVTQSGGRTVTVWSNKELAPTSAKDKDKKEDKPADSETGEKPDIAWSTFHTWKEVGEWYRALAAPQTALTDALRAKADEITRDAKTPEEQVRALYSFVSSRIRYVGIDFGVGRYQPHLAAEVLAYQYGDCKDKDTLFEALLHAKGFHSAPALVGVNIAIVPELPSPASFNHLITTVNLPSGQIWVDATPGVAPFQLLMAPVRDKEALVVRPDGGSALERTPSQTPFQFIESFAATATLGKDGELKGHVTINDRSDNEMVLRLLAQNLAPAQWDQGSQYLANLLGFSGTTSNTTFGRPEEIDAPMQVTYDYTRKPFGDWANFRIVPLFPVNSMPAAPEKLPTAEIDLGALRTESANSRIHLPEGFSADLPDAVHEKTPFATFEKTYRLESGDLVVSRKMVVLKSKLPAASWEDYAKFAKAISLGDETWIQLVSANGVALGSADAKGPHLPKPGENNPAAGQLVRDATDRERSHDWAGAVSKLNEAKAIQPNQPFLWSNYGYVAMVQNKTDEAKEGFRHELSLHPDEGFVVRMFGEFLHRRDEDEEAKKVLSTFLASDPSDGDSAVLLASIQAKASLTEAIETLTKAHDASPASLAVDSRLGDYLIANHQNTDAAALAKKMLDASDVDPTPYNDAAYLLAETDTELPLAEQKSRKSLDRLEELTSSASIEEANDEAFRRSSLLVANWDTLGYILMKEKKLEDAHDYLEAAWRNRPDPVVGAHYGQLLEAQGNLKEAARVYKLSVATPRPETQMALNDIDAGLARLKKAGATSDTGANLKQALQEDRTFKVTVKSTGKSFRSGTFRLQFAAGAVDTVLCVGGESPEGADEAIKKLAPLHLVPSLSKGKMLRDAVLTCSPGKVDCYFVLMPMGGIASERVAN